MMDILIEVIVGLWFGYFGFRVGRDSERFKVKHLLSDIWIIEGSTLIKSVLDELKKGHYPEKLKPGMRLSDVQIHRLFSVVNAFLKESMEEINNTMANKIRSKLGKETKLDPVTIVNAHGSKSAN